MHNKLFIKQLDKMSGSGKGLLGLWLYRSGEQEWAVKAGSPLHKQRDLLVNEMRLMYKKNMVSL